MYRHILISCVVLVLLSSCSKDSSSCGEKSSTSTAKATLIASGDLSSSSKSTTGTARVYQEKNGKHLLSIQRMNLNLGRSLVIYLSSTPTLSSSSIKISSVSSLGENFEHELPGGLNFSVFKYVIILAEPSEEIIASGVLGS